MSHAPSAQCTSDEPEREWDRKSILIIALCCMLNFVDGMDLLVVSFIAPALQKEWGVGAAGFAVVFSVGLAGMALGGLVLAPMADRFGRRRLVLLAIAVMALAMLASSAAQSVVQLAAIRFVVGTGIGTVLACIAALAARVAPPRHRNFAVGVLQAGYPIGAMLTGFVTAWALPLYGWHIVLVGVACVSLLFLPLIQMILPAHIDTGHTAAKVPLAQIVGGARLRSSVLIWSATICGFMALYFITSWITKLAIEAGLPQTEAIIASSIYNLGAFSGTFAMALAGDKLDIRKIGSTLLILTIGMFLIFGGVTMSLGGVLLTAFVMGVTLQGGFNALYPIAARVYPDEVRATGIGWAMGIGRIGAFAGPMVGGWALGQHWPLVQVFAIFCLPLAIAAVAARLIKFESPAA